MCSILCAEKRRERERGKRCDLIRLDLYLCLQLIAPADYYYRVEVEAKVASYRSSSPERPIAGSGEKSQSDGLFCTSKRALRRRCSELPIDRSSLSWLLQAPPTQQSSKSEGSRVTELGRCPGAIDCARATGNWCEAFARLLARNERPHIRIPLQASERIEMR